MLFRSPFWRAAETPFEGHTARFPEPHARLLITSAPDGSHVQAFEAGNHGEGHAHDDSKYEKFCYSTAFAFSVPKSSTLLARGAYDSMLAFSENGRMWHCRYGVESFDLTERRVRFLCRPFAGVTVDTTLYPVGEWHIRVHRIASDRSLLAAEGAYAIRREAENARLAAQSGPDFAVAEGPWGLSGLIAFSGYDRGEVLAVEPNTNLLYPRTAIPTLHASIPPGETVLACAVLGAVTNGREKWRDAPGEEDLHAAMGR